MPINSEGAGVSETTLVGAAKIIGVGSAGTAALSPCNSDITAQNERYIIKACILSNGNGVLSGTRRRRAAKLTFKVISGEQATHTLHDSV